MIKERTKLEKVPSVKIDVGDLYRMLIGECRYGYTRNNHLMPSGAFDECQKYLPLMKKADISWAHSTALQLCDECIGAFLSHFSTCDDDENGNRREYISFIEWLKEFMGDEWKEPYNWKQYLENRNLENEPIYDIYEMPVEAFGREKAYPESITEEDLGDGTLVSTELLSRNNYLDFIFDVLLKGYEAGYYRKKVLKDCKGLDMFLYDIGDANSNLHKVFFIKRR